MNIALGWLAVLAGFAGEPVPRVDGPSISYQFQVIELQGLQWREGAVTGLKPVTSRDGVTVWTAPVNFLQQLPPGAGKQILMAPRVTSLAQTPAHISTRRAKPFVTQVAWRGEGATPRETTETVREGITTTVSGRALDQGVLVQLVIEGTEVRSVHTVNAPDPSARNRVACVAEPSNVHNEAGPCCQSVTQCATQASCKDEMPNSGQAFCPESHCPKTVDDAAIRTSLPAREKETCCADDAAGAKHCQAAQASCGSEAKPTWTASPARSVRVQVPEIGHAEISGEWLIPRDEVLLVGFGPHTVADKDGKAVVRERLAMITAAEIAMPAVAPNSEPLALPRSAANIPHPAAPRLPQPSMPSRTLPQGVHADGTPAELPPLPDDKAEPAEESAEPRPSPQKHKERPKDAPDAKPAVPIDGKTTKAAFRLPKTFFKQTTAPAFGIPNLQFMMPLKPFELRLPFNQKLQLELIGRIVADFDTAEE